jgi:DNA-binding CsgD family transcriptional regulator
MTAVTKKTAPKLTAAVQAELAAMTQTSSRIRFLLAAGYPRGDVARILGIKYQWVRNVEITPLKSA